MLVKAAVRSSLNAVFSDCVGLIDGTLIPLADALLHNKEAYWTRKNSYALNTILVCDHQKRFTYAMIGWCGSAHDQRVFNSSSVSGDLISPNVTRHDRPLTVTSSCNKDLKTTFLVMNTSWLIQVSRLARNVSQPSKGHVSSLWSLKSVISISS